jgi:hypothetical protein
MLAITAIEGPKNLHVRFKIGMPSIMNPINLPDMGRMNGNWQSGAKTTCSLDHRPAAAPLQSLIP